MILGLGLLLVALSGGPSGALQRLQSQSRGSRKAAIVLFVLALLVLGIGVPLAVISSVEARDDIPEANVSNLTAAEQHGRELFGQRCTQCHTLAASNAVAQVGPNLDTLRPPKALVLDALKNGRAQRQRPDGGRALPGPGRRGRGRLRGQGRRADGPGPVAPSASGGLCRKHRKVPLSRLFLRCYDAASHRLSTR